MKFFFILCLFFTYSIQSQSDKPRYYYDEDEKITSKEIYLQKINKSDTIIEYLSIHFESDTCYASLLVRRKNYGKLKQIKYDSLQKSLSGSIAPPKEKFTIIQYHPGKDPCNDGRIQSNGIKNNSFSNRYIKKLKKKMDLKLIRVHKKDSALNFSSAKSMKWRLDKNQTVEKLFFRYHYPCSSFVIINNYNRNYISLYGEHGASTLIEIAKEINKTD